MVNLTTKSVRYFLPAARIVCMSLYKEKPDEYSTQEPLDVSIEQYFFKTQFVNKDNKPQDHIDSTQTSGYQNIDNGKYFVEGYNLAYFLMRERDEKVLMLAEDHFFTNGVVIKELVQNDFDLAYAPWDNDLDANGSILCVNFKKLSHLFPLNHVGIPIERFLQHDLVEKVDPNRRYAITNRKHANYFGDGKYTNSSVEIEQELRNVGIL